MREDTARVILLIQDEGPTGSNPFNHLIFRRKFEFALGECSEEAEMIDCKGNNYKGLDDAQQTIGVLMFYRRRTNELLANQKTTLMARFEPYGSKRATEGAS